MSWPTEVDYECPDCGFENSLEWTSTPGIYQGYCSNPECEGWMDYNYDEALASDEAERAMDARRDERLER